MPQNKKNDLIDINPIKDDEPDVKNSGELLDTSDTSFLIISKSKKDKLKNKVTVPKSLLPSIEELMPNDAKLATEDSQELLNDFDASSDDFDASSDDFDASSDAPDTPFLVESENIAIPKSLIFNAEELDDQENEKDQSQPPKM